MKSSIALFAAWCALASVAFGACALSQTGVWRCPDSGNADNNGLDLWNLLNNVSFSCGDTILLDAGGSYNTLLSSGFYYGFRLKAQAGCAVGQKTQIISTRLAELPPGQRVTFADRTKMAKLVGNGTPIGGGAGVVEFYSTATNNWALRGIMITTSAAVASGGGYFTAVASNVSSSATRKLSEYERNIEFDHVMLMPYEEEAYGSMATATVQAAFFRGINIGLNLNGRNISVHDSYISVGAYDPGTPTVATVTSATAAGPVVITSTGIAAAFGISSQNGCTNGPTDDCYNNFGTRIGIFEGAAGNWTDLNGPKYVVYQSADTLRVYLGNMSARANPLPFDGTGKGSLTGTVTVKRGIPIDPVYALEMSSACQNCSFVTIRSRTAK